MRLYVRTSRNTGVSLGPVALVILGPFLLAMWVVYVVALLVYWAGLVVVAGVEAIGDAMERRQQPETPPSQRTR
jgi:hypothetical protein